jgi:hypothetical protein
VVHDIGDVLGFEPVIDSFEADLSKLFYVKIESLTNLYGTSCSDAIYRLQESRSIGAKNGHSLVAMFLDVIRETSRSVCGLDVGSPENFVVRGYMVDGFCLWMMKEEVSSQRTLETSPAADELTLGSIAAARGKKKVGDNE